MKLDCYVIDGADVDIRPAERMRDWMNATPDRFAYRCLPLSIANAYGWEIRCDEGFDAEWNGGPHAHDVTMFFDGGTATGHFGNGILSFAPSVIFRTSPGFNLWVTGPANRFKDAIQPLSAVVETDWLPLPFTMNWKFTRAHTRIRFEKGEPYCQIFPVRRGQLDQIDPEIRDLSGEPELREQYAEACRQRQSPKADDSRTGEAAPSGVWQSWYTRGKLPDGSSYADDHQRVLALKPFTRRASRKS